MSFPTSVPPTTCCGFGDPRSRDGCAAEAQPLERTLSDLVNAAYHLTPEEIQLMWDTAPPRMPF